MRIVKLFFRFVVLFILIMISIFLGLYWYGNTTFYQSGHLKKQIESDFNLSLSEKPSIIDIDEYGWAEEGGIIALLKLNALDCIKLSNVINDSSQIEDDSILKENNLSDTFTKGIYLGRSNGDFVKYNLDTKKCVLYRKSHVE